MYAPSAIPSGPLIRPKKPANSPIPRADCPPDIKLNSAMIETTPATTHRIITKIKKRQNGLILARISETSQSSGDRGIPETGWQSPVSPNSAFRFPPAKEVRRFWVPLKGNYPSCLRRKMGRLGPGLEDQRDSGFLPPVHLPRFGPQTRCFLVLPGRRENVQDWLAVDEGARELRPPRQIPLLTGKNRGNSPSWLC